MGPASLELTLARTFRVFRTVHAVIEGEHIRIIPGETVLGITRERLRLGPGLCRLMKGRSRFVR
jgi:dCTP deaminase